MNEREQMERMAKTMDEIADAMDYGNFVTASMEREPEPRCHRCQSPGKFRADTCSGCIAELEDRGQAIGAARAISALAAAILTTQDLPDAQMRRLVRIRHEAEVIQRILSQ